MKGPGVERVSIPKLDKLVRQLRIAAEEMTEAKDHHDLLKNTILELVPELSEKLSRNKAGNLVYRTADDFLLTISTGKAKLKIVSAVELAIEGEEE